MLTRCFQHSSLHACMLAGTCIVLSRAGRPQPLNHRKHRRSHRAAGHRHRVRPRRCQGLPSPLPRLLRPLRCWRNSRCGGGRGGDTTHRAGTSAAEGAVPAGTGAGIAGTGVWAARRRVCVGGAHGHAAGQRGALQGAAAIPGGAAGGCVRRAAPHAQDAAGGGARDRQCAAPLSHRSMPFLPQHATHLSHCSSTTRWNPVNTVGCTAVPRYPANMSHRPNKCGCSILESNAATFCHII